MTRISLSEKYRPTQLTDVLDQPKLTGPNGVITKMIAGNNIRSCIFYGPPGCGKTTVAQIMADASNMNFVQMNATKNKVEDIRKLVAQADPTKQTILFLDEIQYFSKKQQQTLLPYVENNDIVLIASTADNPYFCIYDALISRCIGVFEFHPLTLDTIAARIIEVAGQENADIEKNAARILAGNAAGDMRKALNNLELLLINKSGTPQPWTITESDVNQGRTNANMASFDTDGDDHFGLISGLQKSIRGSDPNAAIFYLARLLEGGDLLSPCRRLLVIAHEDIGFGNMMAIPFVQACVDAALHLGLPEATKPLTNAVLCLALSRKCSTAESTYNPAAADIKAGKGGVIPRHLRHACSKGYLYPHDYPNHWVPQQYLPDDLVGTIYYRPGDNAFEQEAASYWAKVMQAYRKETDV